MCTQISNKSKGIINVKFLHTSRNAEVSDCGKWLIVTPMKDCNDNLVFFTELKPGAEIKGKLNLTPIVEKMEADYDVSISVSIVYKSSPFLEYLNSF